MGKCKYPDWEGGLTVGQHSWDKDGYCNVCGEFKEPNTKPCPYCGKPIPDSGIFGLPTYTDVPENHEKDCTIREIMEVNLYVNSP